MIAPINPNYPIVTKSGMMSKLFRLFVQQISDEGLIIGTGAPEGLLEARQGRQYMDDSGITGSILYIKKLDDISGDRTKGWVAV